MSVSRTEEIAVVKWKSKNKVKPKAAKIVTPKKRAKKEAPVKKEEKKPEEKKAEKSQAAAPAVAASDAPRCECGEPVAEGQTSVCAKHIRAG